jgi:hypothetical protein
MAISGDGLHMPALRAFRGPADMSSADSQFSRAGLAEEFDHVGKHPATRAAARVAEAIRVVHRVSFVIFW